MLLIVLGVILCGLLASCTIAPAPLTDHQPSWEGTNQSSGFVGWLPDGRGIITQRARERYNGLITVYGGRFMPPITNDFGLTFWPPDGWVITQEGLVKFTTMNRWRKQDGSK